MTQKTATKKLGSALLQTIDPKEIADEKMRQTVELLIDRSEIVQYPPEKLPEDAEFKGYEDL